MEPCKAIRASLVMGMGVCVHEALPQVSDKRLMLPDYQGH